MPCSQRYSSLTEALSTSGCTSRTQLRQLAEHEKPCCQAALASFFTEQSTKLLPLCSQLRTRPRSQDKCLLMWPAILSISMLDTGNTFFKAASGLMMRPSDNLFLCEKNRFITLTNSSRQIPSRGHTGSRSHALEGPFSAVSTSMSAIKSSLESSGPDRQMPYSSRYGIYIFQTI